MAEHQRSDDNEGLLGDSEALVGEHASGLYRFALSLTRNAERAEDLVQEAFVRALERGGSFRGEASPLTYLRRIVHNLAIDEARTSAREVLVDEVEERWRDDAYTVDVATVVERAATREAIEDALVRLPYIYRSIVVLHDELAWSTGEIARRLELGLPAVKQRLRRGRMILVTALAEGAERREALKGVPMRCWDARIKVSDYIDGILGEGDRARLEAHLDSCPTCPPLYAALRGVKARLGAMRDSDRVVPPDLAARIRRALAS